MIIRYLGHSSFLLESEGGVRIVTDPFGDVGLSFPRLQADGVTVSHFHYDHCNVDAVETEKIFSKAGEYSLGDVKISAFETCHDDCGGKKRGKNLIFRFDFSGVTVCHMGDLGEKFSKELCNKIGRTDALLIPVGGNYTIGAKEAKRYADEIRPRYILPMHYFVKGLTVDIAPPDDFLKLYTESGAKEGAVEIEKRKTLSISAQEIGREEKTEFGAVHSKIIILQRSLD